MDDLAALKALQAQIWAGGDYRPVGEMLAPGAGSLVAAAGQRVLDVGVGNDSVGVAAALVRHGMAPMVAVPLVGAAARVIVDEGMAPPTFHRYL